MGSLATVEDYAHPGRVSVSGVVSTDLRGTLLGGVGADVSDTL